jgi:VIT1/CCC1 family predicted Fe2+/Mn2+ transporter
MNAMSRIVSPHPEEEHKSHRAGWLRAAVLGADDGIVSTASLMIGVATARASDSAILTAGVAGLTAGALSMAVGEYVSVSSQKDAEHADLAIEQRALKNNPKGELEELAHIYVHRGLEPDLAQQVAKQLHAHDALSAHARDELGIYEQTMANPLQAALASGVSFSVGAFVPIIAAVLAPQNESSWPIVVSSLIALAITGGIGAFLGGGHRWRAASRVFVGGGIAMALTALIGHLVGTRL